MRRAGLLAAAGLLALAGCAAPKSGEKAATEPERPAVETTGYTEIGISNRGVVGGAGVRMRRGNFTFGLDF
ncbi:hypothetical protein [Roseivivax sp. CAU 1761]